MDEGNLYSYSNNKLGYYVLNYTVSNTQIYQKQLTRGNKNRS
jgi:hypothetical protein